MLRSAAAVGAAGVVGSAGCLGSTGTDSPASATGTDSPASATGTDGPRTVTDQLGREVEIPGSVSRVVALGPGALELVSYVKATDLVVGVEKSETTYATKNPYNLANPDLSEKPVIGPPKGGDAELIAEQDPELVVATYFTADTAEQLQSKLERPVFVARSPDAKPWDLQDFYGRLQLVGDVLGHRGEADSVVSFVKDTVASLDERTADVPADAKTPAFISGRSHGGGVGATSTQHPFPPFQLVNANNVADEITGHKLVSEEKLLTWDPEVIFVSLSNKDRVMEDFSSAPLNELSAVQSGDLYGVIPSQFYGILYGSMLANAHYVGTVLYPDRFGDADPAAKADEIYEAMVGDAVYGQIEGIWGGFEPLEAP